MERVKALLEDIMQRPETKITAGGQVILSGPIEGTMPQGYCYELFPPLSETAIAQLADGYLRRFPEPLKALYRLTNGAFLFGRNVIIHGLPQWGADYKQPVSLIFEDGHRTDSCPEERLFFATYQTSPQTQLFFDTRQSGPDMHVYAARYGCNDVVAEWPTLADWLIAEHARYEHRYRTGDFAMLDVAPGVLRDITFPE